MNLFLPDNFSESKIIYKEFEEESDIFKIILDKYFINYSIKKIFKLNREEINSENYKIIIEIDSEKKIYLLRKNKIVKKKEQADFYLQLLNTLRQKGVKASEVIFSLQEEFTVTLGNDIYTLFRFIEGEYFKPNLDSLESVAQNIALMHQALNSLSQDLFLKIKEFSCFGQTYFNVVKDYSLDDFASIQTIIEQKKQKTDIEYVFLDNLEDLKKEISLIKMNRNKIENLPQQIIHSDLHPHNILIKDDEVQAILDFEGVRISQQARDVAFAIYRFGRQFFVNKNKITKTEANNLTQLFVSYYEKNKILTEAEKELLPLLVKDEFLRKLLFVLKGIYLDNNYTWSKDLQKFVVAFKEINYFWP